MKVQKTLVAIPKGYKYIEVISVGEIKVKPIKDIPSGSEYKNIYFDEYVKSNN